MSHSYMESVCAASCSGFGVSYIKHTVWWVIFTRCKFSRISWMGSQIVEIYFGLLCKVRLWVAIVTLAEAQYISKWHFKINLLDSRALLSNKTLLFATAATGTEVITTCYECIKHSTPKFITKVETYVLVYLLENLAHCIGICGLLPLNAGAYSTSD